MNKKIIMQMTLSGCLVALAIIFGMFLHFPILGGHLYLIGIIIFLFPLFLNLFFTLLSTIIAVTINDIFTGLPQYVWISILAYTIAIIIIWVFAKFKFKFTYIIGTTLGGIWIIASYFLLEWSTFGLSVAFKDLLATSLEILIVWFITSIIYYPTKILSKALV